MATGDALQGECAKCEEMQLGTEMQFQERRTHVPSPQNLQSKIRELSSGRVHDQDTDGHTHDFVRPSRLCGLYYSPQASYPINDVARPGRFCCLSPRNGTVDRKFLDTVRFKSE